MKTFHLLRIFPVALVLDVFCCCLEGNQWKKELHCIPGILPSRSRHTQRIKIYRYTLIFLTIFYYYFRNNCFQNYLLFFLPKVEKRQLIIDTTRSWFSNSRDMAREKRGFRCFSHQSYRDDEPQTNIYKVWRCLSWIPQERERLCQAPSPLVRKWNSPVWQWISPLLQLPSPTLLILMLCAIVLRGVIITLTGASFNY